MVAHSQNRAGLGVLFIVIAMAAISINDLMIKQLSGGYPLHQIVLVRSVIGLGITLFILQFEGGFAMLKTSNPWQHAMRGVFIVVSNMSFFLALAALPLGEATAMFFAAPLFITLLSIPVLGEKVGPLRISAVIIGFAGVLIMQRPWEGSTETDVSRLVLLLPVIAAFAYALNQVFTRKLGASTKASALAAYIQLTFIVVSVGFFLVAGDGRFAQGGSGPSLHFLLRAWVRPDNDDLWIFLALGLNSGVIGYALSQAYRMADAATVAPFEYIGLPLAVMWGWIFWAEVPDAVVWVGMFLIAGSGLFVFLREQQKERKVARGRVKARY
ncbi:MAG: DMT family transporter [Paracoccaceae bacterium]